MLTARQTGPLAYPRAPRVRGHPTAPRPTSRTRLWSRARPPGHCTGQELSLGAVLEFETGLKRAEQAQRCSPARSCCCYSLEPRGHGPGGPKSRALLRVSDATFGGAWEQGGHGGGAGSGGGAPGACGPRSPGREDPVGSVPGCPARQAAPIRPRAISVGRRAGIRAAPPPRTLGQLRALSGSDRRTRART